MRPAHLARDDVHAMYVVLHALDWLKEQENLIPEGVMMLLPTSPMRLESDILGAINLFHKHSASSVISVIDLGKYLTNLRYLDDVRLMQVAPDENPNAQRQDLKKLFSVNGSIFLARPEVLRIAGTFHVDDAIGYVMDSVNSIDINAPEDLSLARRLCAALPPWKDESN
jgi:CMP-N-acetylneuraminic acid synthetase